MITLKSEREIDLMRKAGSIVALAHQAIAEVIKPGVSTKELDEIAYNVIIENDATPSFLHYNGFPASICASINHVVIHGIPDEKTILKNGDIVSIDIGANYKGYHGDAAKTHIVGTCSPLAKKLIEVTEQSLYEGLKYARPNNHLGDISSAIQQYVEGEGFSVVREFTGHGIGRKLHEDPYVPNYGQPNVGLLLKPGLTIAIEPMVNAGSPKVKVLADNWTTVTVDSSLSAHYEHTIVITNDGYEILTNQPISINQMKEKSLDV